MAKTSTLAGVRLSCLYTWFGLTCVITDLISATFFVWRGLFQTLAILSLTQHSVGAECVKLRWRHSTVQCAQDPASEHHTELTTTTQFVRRVGACANWLPAVFFRSRTATLFCRIRAVPVRARAASVQLAHHLPDELKDDDLTQFKAIAFIHGFLPRDATHSAVLLRQVVYPSVRPRRR